MHEKYVPSDVESAAQGQWRASDAYRKAGNLLEAEKAMKELQQRYPEAKKTARAQP